MPLMRSTAEITPPFNPNRSLKLGIFAIFPCPQGQILLAIFLPFFSLCWLTGWLTNISLAFTINSFISDGRLFK